MRKMTQNQTLDAKFASMNYRSYDIMLLYNDIIILYYDIII